MALRIILSLGLVLFAFLLVSHALVTPWLVSGPSMEPTLRAGDRVLVDRWTYRHRRPRAGEVALLLGPEGLPMIKRVGQQGSGGSIRVLGDNPADSTDSRQLGPLPVERFRGRVVFRYWPPSRIGPVRSRNGIIRDDLFPERR